MDPRYRIADTADLFTPSLIFYKDQIRKNIARALVIARGPTRLRPHVKTHKTREIARMQIAAGITKHKCATIAEAEMLASCSASDILLAYPMVGPNCHRLARLAEAYPSCSFSVVADDAGAVRTLSDAMQSASKVIDVLLDVDVGQHRTGVPLGDEAIALYKQFGQLPGLRPGGLHVYDGHNQQDSMADRRAAVEALLETVLTFRQRLLNGGLAVPRMVFGGTPTFPLYAQLELPGVECTPGTCFLHDHGYASHFPDLGGFIPAAVVLTRVVSRPTPTRVTLDLGTKAIASDPPAGQRCQLLDVPDYRPIIHNEEHMVVETPQAGMFHPGDVVYAVPTHICPTCALHRQAYVVEDGQVTDRWDIVARDRVLTF
jgi:D-serine deaminase-like pyridoxal phosphate-dependent protein